MAERRILTVVGARPQFVKAAAISRAIAGHAGISEILIHTGQHFDPGMSQIFLTSSGSKRRASISASAAAVTAR